MSYEGLATHKINILETILKVESDFISHANLTLLSLAKSDLILMPLVFD